MLSRVRSSSPSTGFVIHCYALRRYGAMRLLRYIIQHLFDYIDLSICCGDRATATVCHGTFQGRTSYVFYPCNRWIESRLTQTYMRFTNHHTSAYVRVYRCIKFSHDSSLHAQYPFRINYSIH